MEEDKTLTDCLHSAMQKTAMLGIGLLTAGIIAYQVVQAYRTPDPLDQMPVTDAGIQENELEVKVNIDRPQYYSSYR